jgi:hypothetical protein
MTIDQLGPKRIGLVPDLAKYVPQPARRLHLHLDRGGLALRVGRDRPVLATGGRLVDERRHDGPAGCGRPSEGRLEARQAA